MTAADLEIVLVPRRKIKTDLIDGVPRTQMPEYRIWRGMITRCSNPATRNYERYGGRGITVCSSWLEDFKNFYLDVGPRPTDKHSIDRIDNDGNYEPGNCRWATSAQQSANRSPSSSLDKSNPWYWTEADVATLEHMWAHYYRDQEIAAVLGKTAGSVKIRAHTMGLTRERGMTLMVKKNPELVHLLRNDGPDRFVAAITEKHRAQSAEKRGRTARGEEKRAANVVSILGRQANRADKMREMRAAGLTLAEIGKEFGITRERVRQLEARGFPNEAVGGIVSGKDRKISSTNPKVKAVKISRLCRAWNKASREAKAEFLLAAPGFISSNISLDDVLRHPSSPSVEMEKAS